MSKAEEVEEVARHEEEGQQNFAELLGPNCVIKRVDKNQKVIGNAKPEEMQHVLMSRAATQKRLGACAEHVKNLSRKEKMHWALDLKDQANRCYATSNFEEAAQLYNDCLVALDFEGTEEENAEVATKLQLPICTNLAACLIEMGKYEECIDMCNIALSVEEAAPKALYRRGLARYRLGDYAKARPDLEAAQQAIADFQQAVRDKPREEVAAMNDLDRRVRHYLLDLRRFNAREKEKCQKIFNRKAEAKSLYDDRPDVKEEVPKVEIDDSDEAIEAKLRQFRGDFHCCCCRVAIESEISRLGVATVVSFTDPKGGQ